MIFILLLFIFWFLLLLSHNALLIMDVVSMQTCKLARITTILPLCLPLSPQHPHHHQLSAISVSPPPANQIVGHSVALRNLRSQRRKTVTHIHTLTFRFKCN